MAMNRLENLAEQSADMFGGALTVFEVGNERAVCSEAIRSSLGADGLKWFCYDRPYTSQLYVGYTGNSFGGCRTLKGRYPMPVRSEWSRLDASIPDIFGSLESAIKGCNGARLVLPEVHNGGQNYGDLYMGLMEEIARIVKGNNKVLLITENALPVVDTVSKDREASYDRTREVNFPGLRCDPSKDVIDFGESDEARFNIGYTVEQVGEAMKECYAKDESVVLLATAEEYDQLTLSPYNSYLNRVTNDDGAVIDMPKQLPNWSEVVDEKMSKLNVTPEDLMLGKVEGDDRDAVGNLKETYTPDVAIAAVRAACAMQAGIPEIVMVCGPDHRGLTTVTRRLASVAEKVAELLGDLSSVKQVDRRVDSSDRVIRFALSRGDRSHLFAFNNVDDSRFAIENFRRWVGRYRTHSVPSTPPSYQLHPLRRPHLIDGTKG